MYRALLKINVHMHNETCMLFPSSKSDSRNSLIRTKMNASVLGWGILSSTQPRKNILTVVRGPRLSNREARGETAGEIPRHANAARTAADLLDRIKRIGREQTLAHDYQVVVPAHKLGVGRGNGERHSCLARHEADLSRPAR